MVNTNNGAAMRPEDYVHRENYDGSLDSICVHCGALIARAAQCDYVELQEEQHSCLHGIVARTLLRHTFVAA
jgi:hypothetical protein